MSSPYVMLSRGKRLDQLAVLGIDNNMDRALTYFNRPLPRALHMDHERLQTLHDKTMTS